MRSVLLPIRCGECARLLAKAAQFVDLQIKCPRCGTLNHMKAQTQHYAEVTRTRLLAL